MSILGPPGSWRHPLLYRSYADQVEVCPSSCSCGAPRTPSSLTPVRRPPLSSSSFHQGRVVSGVQGPSGVKDRHSKGTEEARETSMEPCFPWTLVTVQAGGMSGRLPDPRPLTALLRDPNGRGQRPGELFLASLGLGLSHPTEASVSPPMK